MNKLSEQITLNEDIFDVRESRDDLAKLKLDLKISSHIAYQDESANNELWFHDETNGLLIQSYEEIYNI